MTTALSAAHAARRQFLTHTAWGLSAAAAPLWATAQTPARTFSPQPGRWRTFEVTTRVDIAKPQSKTQLWLPVPSVNTNWQQSLGNSFASNGVAHITHAGQTGAQLLYVEFDADQSQPFAELTSRIQTQSRAQDWTQPPQRSKDDTVDAASLRAWTRPTHLLPTDGIVRKTALQAIGNARSDVEKAQKIFDWVVNNTYREPKVRGCGEGDIKTMLETENLGGKCADLNALFVGMCRSVGLPARDVYGLRLAPSAFGYKELGGNSANLKGAQHCRAEVYLRSYGWVAMDPADVAKVMRQETSAWIKAPQDPLVAPVNRGLFGGWEGNWMAYNMAHDVTLPHANSAPLGFLMYPTAQTAQGRLDSYAPDDFKYQITAREITA